MWPLTRSTVGKGDGGSGGAVAGGTGLDSMKLLGVGGPAVTSEKRGRLLDGERLESESKS